jgi:hypothetical protein
VAGSSPIVNGTPAWDTFIPVNKNNNDNESSVIPPSSIPPHTSLRKVLLASPQKKDEEEKEENDDISPSNAKFVLYQSRALARYLLRDIWVRFEARYECKATWEVDGVVSGIRLKRARVGFAREDDDE